MKYQTNREYSFIGPDLQLSEFLQMKLDKIIQNRQNEKNIDSIQNTDDTVNQFIKNENQINLSQNKNNLVLSAKMENNQKNVYPAKKLNSKSDSMFISQHELQQLINQKKQNIYASTKEKSNFSILENEQQIKYKNEFLQQSSQNSNLSNHISRKSLINVLKGVSYKNISFKQKLNKSLSEKQSNLITCNDKNEIQQKSSNKILQQQNLSYESPLRY